MLQIRRVELVESRLVTHDFLPSLFNFVFRCSHSHVTRPITPVHRPGTPAAATYVACLDCGRRFPYALSDAGIGLASDPATDPLRVPARRTA